MHDAGSPLSSPPHPHGSFDPEKEYKIKSIIDEDNKCYLISWESDEETGEKFDPTWEPKANANLEAVKDWKRIKAERKKEADRKSNVNVIVIRTLHGLMLCRT